MKVLVPVLAFFAGASMVCVFTWILLIPETPPEQQIIAYIALSWFAGIAVGAWVAGIAMFCFGRNIAHAVADRMKPRRRRRVPVEEEGIDLIEAEEVIALDGAEIIEEDDGVTIYEDPDWWKDEKKREQHRRNQDHA